MKRKTEADNGCQERGSWYVYILRCADGSLYTGITNDVERRLAQHNSVGSTTKYTRSRQPVELVYFERATDRAAALRREIKIKQMATADKAQLAEGPRDKPACRQDVFELSETAINGLKKRYAV